jgi:CHAT domain-containing protein
MKRNKPNRFLIIGRYLHRHFPEDFSESMKKVMPKVSIIPIILVLLVLFNVNTFSQNEPTLLTLNTPLEIEVTKKESKFFEVQLLANQTARIEVEQKGIEVSLKASDPTGQVFIAFQSPSGRFGNELMFVTAAETGDYKIEVQPWHFGRTGGKFVINLSEIRQTVPEDHLNNQAGKQILRVYQEINEAEQKGTVADRRKALIKAEELIELTRVKQDKVWEGLIWRKVGVIHKSLGEFQESLEAHISSLETWRDIKNRYHEGNSLNSIGSLWFNVGEYEKAISYQTEAIKIAQEQKSRLNETQSLNNVGLAYLHLNQLEKAVEIFENKVIPLFIAMKFPRGEAAPRLNLGSIYIRLGDYPKGIENLRKGLDLTKKFGRSTEIANAQIMFGTILLEGGEIEEAYENLSQANELAVKIGNRQYIVSSLYYLARIEREKGHMAKAIENLEKAIEIAEKTRSQITNKNLRISYFSTVQNSYELYIDLLIERSKKNNSSDDIIRAFEISERSRSRSLIDLLQEAKVSFKQGINSKLLEKEKDLRIELNDRYQKRERLFTRKPNQDQIDKITSEINDLTIDLEKLNLQIGKENPRYADLTDGRILSTKAVQNLLDDETVLLEYKLGKKRSFVWFITKDSIDVHILPPQKEIDAAANRLYSLITANDRTKRVETFESSKELGRILFSSFAQKLSNKRLAIVADGVLQYTPFSALLVPNSNKQDVNILTDSNEIVILPSASVLAQIRENPNRLKTNEKAIAIFADPVFDAKDARIKKDTPDKKPEKNAAIKGVLRDLRFGETLPRLLASRQEARNISGLIKKDKSSVKTGFEASLINIENSDLTDYKILHFATHGLLNSSHPELSGLVFSLYDQEGNPQKGFLSLNDVYNLNLSSDMIVLSACQTALGKEVRGEGLIGLSRGFLYAGSNRIVASLWKVDDSATAEFMERFYRNHLQKGMSATSSLRQAKMEMKNTRRYSSPYYWSAFTLLGDWK